MAEGYIQLNVFDHLISIFTKSGTWGRVGGGGGGGTPIDWDTGCAIF